MEMLLLIYNFIAFAIGVFSVGCIYTLTKSNKSEVIRSYWIFYNLFTLFIGIFLLGTVMNKLGYLNQVGISVLYSVQFLSLFLSLYVLVYLINQIYQVPNAKIRNILFLLFFLAWWGLCSFTEFAMIKEDGIWLFVEDEVLILVFYAYAILTYWRFKKNIENKKWYRNTQRILFFVILCTPGLILDGLTAGNGTLLYFTPAMFSFISIVNIHTISQYNQEVQDTQYTVESDFRAKYSITERENDVIVLLLKGYSYAKIAETLVISISTVRTHVMNIYKKVGVNSRYELLNKVY